LSASPRRTASRDGAALLDGQRQRLAETPPGRFLPSKARQEDEIGATTGRCADLLSRALDARPARNFCCPALGLAVGKSATAVMKSSDVIVAVE